MWWCGGLTGETVQERRGLAPSQVVFGCERVWCGAGGDSCVGHPRDRIVLGPVVDIAERMTLPGIGVVLHVVDPHRGVTTRHRRIGPEARSDNVGDPVVTRPLRCVAVPGSPRHVSVPGLSLGRRCHREQQRSGQRKYQPGAQPDPVQPDQPMRRETRHWRSTLVPPGQLLRRPQAVSKRPPESRALTVSGSASTTLSVSVRPSASRSSKLRSASPLTISS